LQPLSTIQLYVVYRAFHKSVISGHMHEGEITLDSSRSSCPCVSSCGSYRLDDREETQFFTIFLSMSLVIQNRQQDLDGLLSKTHGKCCILRRTAVFPSYSDTRQPSGSRHFVTTSFRKNTIVVDDYRWYVYRATQLLAVGNADVTTCRVSSHDW
jgi:hypothetical protein